jgi:hypothetical protein
MSNTTPRKLTLVRKPNDPLRLEPGEALVVDIEPDVEHGCLLKSLYLGNAATEFQVTQLTGAFFIVSTPMHVRRCL